jgi:hypothetical protein
MSRTVSQDSAWQHRQKFEDGTARPWQYGAALGRLRAGSMKDVLSAPHGVNPRVSDYVPYDGEKKSPALGGGGAVDGSHVSMSVILPAGRQRKPKGCS